MESDTHSATSPAFSSFQKLVGHTTEVEYFQLKRFHRWKLHKTWAKSLAYGEFLFVQEGFLQSLYICGPKPL